MTNFDLIAEAIELMNAGDNEKATARLKQFVKLNTPKTKGGKVKIYDWIDAKSYHQFTHGVYHDDANKVAVATDTYVMLVSKPDYDESCNEKIIAKDGEEITDVKFPDYKRVIPKAETLQEIEVNRQRIADLLSETKAESKIDKSVVYAALNISSRETPCYISPKFCKLLLTLPEGKFHYEVNRPMLYKSNDGNYTAIIMPVYVKDEYIGEDKITKDQSGWN